MQYLQILLRIMRFSGMFSSGARHLRRFFRMREHLADIICQQMRVVCRINQPFHAVRHQTAHAADIRRNARYAKQHRLAQRIGGVFNARRQHKHLTF